MNVRTRFAPSPTGYMHIGNLRTALYTWLFARKHHGVFVLRIEDTDQERQLDGATEVIYDSLSVSGLNWDEGPDKGGAYGPYIQSERKPIYREHAEHLIETGAAYRCFCTKERLDTMREEYEARGETFKYDKHCLHLAPDEVQRRMDAGEPYVIRQNVPTEGIASFEDVLYGHIEVECAQLDDNVLLKSDGLPTYNFANVVDDHLMEITHVIRGTEYLSSAPKYNLLYQAFGWETPQYIHTTPVMKDATRKLSKRAGDPSFEDLMRVGYLKDAIINYIAFLGWNPGTNQELFSLEELTEAFDVSGLSKSPSIFDIQKLTWFNAEYVRRLPFETYCELARPWLKQAGAAHFDEPLLCSLLHTRTEVFDQIPKMVAFLIERPEIDIALYTHKKMKTDPTVSIWSLRAALDTLTPLEDWTQQGIHDALMACAGKEGLKTGQMFWPMRIAISGQESTPGGAIEIAVLLGKEETLKRMHSALAQLELAVL